MHSTVIMVESMSATSSCLRRPSADWTTTSVAGNVPSSAVRAASGARPNRRSAAQPLSSQPCAAGRQPASSSRSRAAEISPPVRLPDAISVAMNMASPLPAVALIAGPTASGKSALAIAIAEARDGVVINADSAQVYADLRILSARPTPGDEARVPHRLFGHVDGADIYSAARWAAEART